MHIFSVECHRFLLIFTEVILHLRRVRQQVLVFYWQELNLHRNVLFSSASSSSNDSDYLPRTPMFEHFQDTEGGPSRQGGHGAPGGQAVPLQGGSSRGGGGDWEVRMLAEELEKRERRERRGRRRDPTPLRSLEEVRRYEKTTRKVIVRLNFLLSLGCSRIWGLKMIFELRLGQFFFTTI